MRALPSSAVVAIPALILTSAIFAADTSTVEEYFDRLHAEGEFNGSVLIGDADGIQFQAGYGLANEETHTKLEPGTPHRIASVTKGFTAVLALQAVERHEVALHETLLEHFPEVKRPELAGITLRHLLTHGSGLADFVPEPAEGESTAAALVRGLATTSIAFAPGERFSYVNVNYTIIGAILERATQRSYADLLQERILQPAGMTATYLDVGANATRPRAIGYERKDGALVREEEPDLSRFIGAGSIVSTTDDLYRFSRALAGDVLLAPASRKLMLTAQNQRYAMGCMIMNPGKDEIAQLFLGGMTGTSTVLARFNDGGRTIVILSNRSNVPTNRIVPQVYRLVTAGR